jgi:hypothetical protein
MSFRTSRIKNEKEHGVQASAAAFHRYRNGRTIDLINKVMLILSNDEQAKIIF